LTKCAGILKLDIGSDYSYAQSIFVCSLLKG